MHGRELLELMCGMLLGDGSMYPSAGYKGQNKAVYFSITHAIKQEDYLIWKLDLINQFFKNHKIDKEIKPQYFQAKCNDRFFPSVRFATAWKKFFPLVYKRVYNKSGGKNFEYLLSRVYSDFHLALWVMDDGNEDRSYTKSKIDKNIKFKRTPRYRIAVQGLTEGELNLAVQWFQSKFQITPRISPQWNGPIFRFTVRDSEKIFNRILPYISQLPSMRHKFIWSFEKYCPKETRSTLNENE